MVNGNSVDLVDFMNGYSFLPHISIPTRRSHEGNGTIIDHIWSIISSDPQAGIFSDVQITDHQILKLNTSLWFFP